MMRKLIWCALAAAVAITFASREAHAWGACHAGYTHVGPHGVYHAGFTAARGPGGRVYGGAHVGGWGAGGGSFHAGYVGGAGYGGAVRVGGVHYGGAYGCGGFRAVGVSGGGFHAGVYHRW